MLDEFDVRAEVSAEGLADFLGSGKDILSAEEVSVSRNRASGFVFSSLGGNREHHGDFGAEDAADAVDHGSESPDGFVGAADLGGVDRDFEGPHGFGHEGGHFLDESFGDSGDAEQFGVFGPLHVSDVDEGDSSLASLQGFHLKSRGFNSQHLGLEIERLGFSLR